MQQAIEIRRVGGSHPAARALIAAMEAWVSDGYGPVAPDRTSVVEPDEMDPPDGDYVAIWLDGEPVAGGGVRRLEDGVAEIKRMFVEPEHRGTGLGRRVLGELEAAARDLGFTRTRLDTHERGAGFYEAAGYVAIPDYNGNSYAEFWGEKAL